MNEQTTYYPNKGQNVAYTASAAPVAALEESTTVVRLRSTSDCWVAFNGTASVGGTNSFPLTAKAAEYFTISSEDIISVIQDSAAGSLHVMQMTQ